MFGKSTMSLNEAANFNEQYVDLYGNTVDVKTPHEERKQLRLQRKHAVKDRDLDRRQKRQDKRRQFY